MSAEKCCYRFYCLTEWKAGSTTKAIHQRLQDVWGEDAPAFSTVKRWIQKFKEQDQPALKDEPRSGRPRSSLAGESITTLKELIDPRSSLRSLESITGIPRETIRHILNSELKLRKVYSAWVPHLLPMQAKSFV